MKNAYERGGESGDGTDPTEFTEMSAENKAWLEKVMSEGLVDLVKRAGEIVDDLKAKALVPVRTEPPAVLEGHALDSLLDLLDELLDIVGQIDFAQSLVQIGGIPPLIELMHPATPVPDELKSAALGVLATVAQNNPFAQDALLNLRLLPLLKETLLDRDRKSPSLRVKALHCTSCLVRSYPPAEAAFFAGVVAPPTDPTAAAPAATTAAKATAAGEATKDPAAPPPAPPPPPAPWAVASYFTSEGLFVDGGLAEGDPRIGGRPAAWTIPGPEVLAQALGDPEVRVRRKVAFLVNALCTSEDPSSQAEGRVAAYYEACGAALAALVPPAPPTPPGERGAGGLDGLDVDTRETALRALTTFAEAGCGPALMAGHGDSLRLAAAAAGARAAAAKKAPAGGEDDGDVENAEAEAGMWSAFLAAAKK